MGVQAAALLTAESAVLPARDRELCAVARDQVLELLRQRAPRPEEQRLERAHRRAEDLGDLLVGPPLELAHHQRLALGRRDALQRADELLDRGRLVVGL